MKVKRKYFFFGCSIILFIGFSILFFIILKAYKISSNHSKSFIENGFRFSASQIPEIEEYISSEQKNIDILHYIINIEVFPKRKIILGKTIINGIFKNSIPKNIELNFNDNFDISSLLLNGKLIEYIYEDDKLKLPVDINLKDSFSVEVNYSGRPNSLGFGSFSFDENKKMPVIYTLNEPIYASTWFPCNDLPKDKVLADIIITCDSSLTAVSNGILKSVELLKNKKTFHWKTNYPISTYLIYFSAAKYKTFSDDYVNKENDSMKIEYYVFPEDLEKAKRDFSIHPKALNFFSQTFGEYPFINEKYGVAEFLWSFGAMENQTITAIGKNFISGSQFFTDMLVHELAHQWWGNAVTLSNWKDIWLNEGFATYSEALYYENQSGVKSLQSTMKSFLTDFSGTTLYNPVNLFDRVIYNKGAWVLHMLRNEVGDDNFFNILRNYFETYKYKNASTFDFIKIAENITKKELTDFFNQWVFSGSGIIELEYSYKPKGNNPNEILLNLSQIQKEYYEYHFNLDINFIFIDGTEELTTIKIEKRNNSFTFNFEKKIREIQFDPKGWLACSFKQISKEN